MILEIATHQKFCWWKKLDEFFLIKNFDLYFFWQQQVVLWKHFISSSGLSLKSILHHQRFELKKSLKLLSIDSYLHDNITKASFCTIWCTLHFFVFCAHFYNVLQTSVYSTVYFCVLKCSFVYFYTDFHTFTQIFILSCI